ncbi:hypothetical protein ACIA98_40710 [Streptomyces sp. NPDC051366]|uniref:hypothetical protein n=1 Tax=Streptomyces sp. NPDC051366 TaxID=3365652 RepID=UPI00378D57A4
MATWRIGTTAIHKVLEVELPVLLTAALRTNDTALLKRYPWPAPDFSGVDEAALERKSFRDRIAEKLAEDPAWG